MAKNTSNERYFTMDLPELERENQRLDREIQALREEKKAVSTAMDRHIHRTNAQAMWDELGEAERIALKQVAQEN